MEIISDYRILCEKMDNLSVEEKEKSVLFGLAVGALEGAEVSEETKNEIQAWLRGEKTFLEVFQNTLSRYGFPLN